MYDHVERTLSGVLVVQAFNGEERAEAEMASETDDVLHAAVREVDTQLRFKILTGLAMALGTAAVFFIGAHHAMSGRLTTGRGHRLRFVPLLAVRPARVAHVHVVDGAGCGRQCAPRSWRCWGRIVRWWIGRVRWSCRRCGVRWCWRV